MELKPYQQQVINDLSLFLEQIQETKNVSDSFYNFWVKHPRTPLFPFSGTAIEPYKNNVPRVPHICVKVPTAGGKTFIACNAIKTIFDAFDYDRHKAVVWLVPSITILEQTIRNLKDPSHPYRQKINSHFGNKVEVFDKSALLQGSGFNATSVQEQLNIFVLSFDSIRTANKEGRKVYEQNGSLQSFESLLGTDEEISLMKVMHYLNPLVIVDESHNAETDLSVDMLKAFNPCFILDLLVDRYAVTRQEALRVLAYDVLQGIRLCATSNGATGFLARAVCHEDLRSAYPNSSRDQYTHAVHGLWRYVHSPLCGDGAKAEIGAVLSAIADRMTRNVTPANDYDSLRSDGSRDTRGISRMWNVKGHEAARLPMIYAVAWDVTGRRDCFDLYRTYVGPAVEQSLAVEDKQPTYALLQMQDSMEVLLALETDPALKSKMRQIMATVARRCAARAANADKAAAALDLTMLCTDWRTGEGLRTGGAYRKVWYNIRESGETALTQLMDRGTPYPAEQQALLSNALLRLNYDKVSSGGIFYLQAAYWKARARGLLNE
jgi:hypothetical protein